MARNTVICLLRNDLRVHDNEVLSWACKNGKNVIPLYCFDPRHYEGTYNYKFKRTAVHRLRYILESVKDLRTSLQGLGSSLVVRQAKPHDAIAELHKQYPSIGAVCLQREVTKEELGVEDEISEFAKSCDGIHVQKIWGSTLYHVDDMPYESIDQVHSIYTHFRNKMEKNCEVRSEIDMPKEFPSLPEGIDEGVIPSVTDFNLSDVEPHENTAFPFSGGETSGLDRVKKYIWDTHHVDTYKETRNDLIGPEYSTKFSPWLALGCVSPRYIYWELKRYMGQKKSNTDGPYWIIFELIWRDFFKYAAMKHGNKFFFSYGIKTYTDESKKPVWKYDDDQFKAWSEGMTGIPFVDANMREMLATGWMSNRGRQNIASFLARDLQLDWRMGAEWLESYLLDHDVCSNYGNWMWTAGVGGDPRGAYRKFNMIKQGIDYDPQGEYIRMWIPELRALDGPSVHAPWALSLGELKSHGIALGKTYPKPIITAPEWDKHIQAAKKMRSGPRSASGKERGLDFYFKKGESS